MHRLARRPNDAPPRSAAGRQGAQWRAPHAPNPNPYPNPSPPPNTQVTNGMLLKQGIPVMIPVMWVACFVLIQQARI